MSARPSGSFRTVRRLLVTGLAVVLPAATLSLAASPGEAASAGHDLTPMIKGHLVHAGAPVSDAVVFAYRKTTDGAWAYAGGDDSWVGGGGSGAFAIYNLRPGTYRLLVEQQPPSEGPEDADPAFAPQWIGGDADWSVEVERSFDDEVPHGQPSGIKVKIGKGETAKTGHHTLQEPAGRLKGTVLDEQGNPPIAEVAYDNRADGLPGGRTITDSLPLGENTIGPLELGTHTIRVRSQGDPAWHERVVDVTAAPSTPWQPTVPATIFHDDSQDASIAPPLDEPDPPSTVQVDHVWFSYTTDLRSSGFLHLTYQWLRDGEPIEGETGRRHELTDADTGTALTVRVTAHHQGYEPATTVTEPYYVPRFDPEIGFSFSQDEVKFGNADDVDITVTVATPDGTPGQGTVRLTCGNEQHCINNGPKKDWDKTVTLGQGGTATTHLPKWLFRSWIHLDFTPAQPRELDRGFAEAWSGLRIVPRHTRMRTTLLTPHVRRGHRARVRVRLSAPHVGAEQITGYAQFGTGPDLHLRPATDKTFVLRSQRLRGRGPRRLRLSFDPQRGGITAGEKSIRVRVG